MRMALPKPTVATGSAAFSACLAAESLLAYIKITSTKYRSHPYKNETTKTKKITLGVALGVALGAALEASSGRYALQHFTSQNIMEVAR